MVCMANRFLVMLHHHQRIALVAQRPQSTQQNLVVPGMQTNRRLIQHITHTLQIAAQLRRQSDALCLTTAKRGRATVQRQITQPHFFQKFETALDLWHQVARNVALARGHATNHLQRLHPLAHIGHT